ncbi:MAG: hypothetical protein R3330_18125 [Saprospiraceae bacterium]|nr:hypothetical protein [Saprospiraceae bacterium]
MRWMWLCCVCLIWWGCGREEPELPATDEQLIEILIDLHLAEGAMQRVPAEWKDSIGAEVRSRIARAHALTPEDMEALIGQLQLMPEKSMMLYDSVVARLDKGQTSRSDESPD